MNIMRRIPLFVRIGLMWWIVLFAYSPSRPYLLYRFWLEETHAAPAQIAVTGSALFVTALSLLHTLGTAWLLVRLLDQSAAGRSPLGVAIWTVVVAWFAVAGWCLVMTWVFVAPPRPDLMFQAISLLPWLAFTEFWEATWVVVPLALASVAIISKHARKPQTTATAGTAG